ncbi:MAG: DNA primase, partial [Acholeplasmatales bacterium]|nr:DNA primase [Acholeplasmatales bacterium]
MALDPKFIDLVNEKNDIVSLVTENGIVLEKAGKNYKGLCPFHADTNPSFFVSPERNLCNCFTCKTGGNPVNFYMKIKNVSFVDSIIYLAARAGLEIPSDIKKTSVNDKFYKMYTLACAFYETILSSSEIGKVATNYLQKREITSKEIKKFHLGFSQTNNGLYNMLKSKGFTDNDILEAGLVVKNDNQTFIDLFRNRLMIPITDGYGRVVAFSGRLIEKNDNQPKYVNSPESPIFKKGKTVYNIFEASDEIRKNKSVIIMEGFFDLIQSYKAGIQNVVVMMGTSITPNHISLIKEKTESVLLAFDGDDAGAKAMIKAIPHFIKASLKLEILAFPDKLDPDEFIRQNGPENFEFLFQNNIYSPYAFIYSYYKRNLDVNDINSITTFKAGVSESFAHAEIIIKEQYQKQIFDELKINIDFSSKNQVSASNYNPTPPPSLPQFTKPNT